MAHGAPGAAEGSDCAQGTVQITIAVMKIAPLVELKNDIRDSIELNTPSPRQGAATEFSFETQVHSLKKHPTPAPTFRSLSL
ncbi:hypothetical protein BCCH1_78220 (plasmid) [Burkholderia contaminans]|uniref:Uncharacterized protein n=1 Tax=Burkholderia contaminans TaxID=488447 RepID=A0A250LP94_9BURK|nr:hypothetical protein BCCH1_78220 [Burkholderia contaminans]